MEANSWRPAKNDPAAGVAMEASSVDWRTQLQPEARQRVVNKIMETLKKHLPISVPEGLNELQKIAIRFEEKIYTAAVSQSDYLRKISLKMLSMESKTQQNAPINPSISSGTVSNQNPADTASLGIQSQINNQAQSLSMPIVNQTSTRQQMFPQNMQNNNSTAVENSANNYSSLSSFKTLNQSTVSSAGQNISGMSQSAASNSIMQTATPDIYANAQRQMQGRQQQQPMMSQQQQQSQNQLIYQHQLQVQQQLLKQQKLQQSSLQSHVPQQQPQPQQQQSLMQTTKLQPSQQPLMQMQSSLQSAQSSIPPTQPGAVQSSSQSGLRQNQLSSVQQSVPTLLQQHPQSVARPQQQPQPTLHQQASALQQQPASVSQQSNLPLQQHQPQLIGSQTNVSNIQQSQLLGQQTSVTEMQQQPQRIPVQQNTILNMQQSQQMLNQQNISLHQKQLGAQNNSMSGLQQQQQVQGSLSGVSNMQPQQRPIHMMQHSKLAAQQQQQYQHQQQPAQQSQHQQTVAALQSQNQQSQHQQSQQLMSQIQSQPVHSQQHLTMQQQPNNLQREIQQRFQPSGTLLTQNTIEQQKQFVQSQRTIPDVPSSAVDSTSSHLASADWQEEAYQKIKSMKELYFADMNELYQRILMKMQQHETLMPAVRQSDQYEKMKSFKIMLERILYILDLPMGSIQPILKDKLPLYEKQIISFLASNKKGKPSQSSGQQLQHSGSHIQSLAQQQPGQVGQIQQQENHANQMQQMNLQGSSASMQRVPHPNSQHGSISLSTQFSASTTQQTLPNSLQSGTTLDQVQGSSFSSLQQGPIGSMQQNVVSGQSSVNVPQQNNITNLSHNSMNTLQNNAMQPSSSILQQQIMKQQSEQQQQQQHMMQTQQIKQQFQQRQMQQQMIQQKQQFLQTQQPVQQQKQQSSAQMPMHQMTQFHQSTEPSELKVRQTSGIKPGLYPQHYSASQRQQFKPSAAFPISSPQNLQASSPQISHSSPQVDQQSLLASQIKSGTPLQSANSPFAPSPSTSFAPSPIHGDSEKPLSGISSLSGAGHVGIQQPPVAPSQVQQLSVATPGMSASPLLQEFTSADGNQSNLPTAAASKTGATENPLDRIIKMVGSSKANVLSSAISDIGSVVSMVDRIAGSAPVNGSRGAVGEDLVAMTKCRLQARNFMTQDGSTTKKMKRDTSAMPLNNMSSGGSVSDNFKQSYGLHTSELESTATSRAKQRKTEVNHALLEEIKEINQRLIGTVVTISEEDDDSITAASEGEGTIIKCSFTPVALSPSLKSQFASAQMSPILPLRLLVSANYPKCSPVLLDKLPDDLSAESDDLSIKAKSRFSISLRSLSQPVSLGEMAKTWEACAHKVIAEYAQQIGGGCFSSRYGAWENCVGA